MRVEQKCFSNVWMGKKEEEREKIRLWIRGGGFFYKKAERQQN